MRTAFLQVVAFLIAFAPFIQAQAKAPGGYPPGTSFKLTVTERSSIRISQFATNDHASIPKGIPKFKKGQRVKFTIGKKGELKASGMSLSIIRGDDYGSIYGKQIGSTRVYLAQLSKEGNKPPTLIVLSFQISSGSGFAAKTQTVSYILE